jgi:hypothetical protein
MEQVADEIASLAMAHHHGDVCNALICNILLIHPDAVSNREACAVQRSG